MDEKRAAVEAFGGVELRFGEHILRPAALTVSETARYLDALDGLADEGTDPVDKLVTIEAFTREFGERIGLGPVPLAALGLECDEVQGIDPATTFDDAIALLDTLHDAQWHESVIKRSLAQVAWLDRAPEFFGLDSGALDAPALFEIGSTFASALYLCVYGLAQDFCSRLAVGPRATTWVMVSDQPARSISAGGLPT